MGMTSGIDELVRTSLAGALQKVQQAEKALTPVQDRSSLISRAQNCLIEASVCLALAIARDPNELRREVNIFIGEKRK